MTNRQTTLLVVDADPHAAGRLAREAEARGYAVRTVESVDAACDLIERDPADAILIDLVPGAERAVDLLPTLTRLTAGAEVLVMSSEPPVAAALQWFDPEAFAFVPKGDLIQVFAALARSLERRRITGQNQRLVWELQTLNAIAAGIPRSLDLDGVLTRALQGLVGAMDVEAGSIRLRDEATGRFERVVVIGPDLLRRHHIALEGGTASDQVIATRTPVIVDDFAASPAASRPPEDLPLRSAIGVPLCAGPDLVGTLTLGSSTAGRFDSADERLLSSVACQLVVAIQNVRLHQTIRQGKMEWEATFDAISDPIAVFNNRGELLRGNLALADHLDLPITALRHLTCQQTGFCGGGAGPCACQPVHTDRSPREVTLPDGRIFSVTAFPVNWGGQGASVVQVAKNVTEEIRSARRLQQMSRELAAMNDRLVTALDRLKAMQAQLVQSEKLSAIGHLVAGVAHELNNPLTSVIGYAQLVEEELAQGPTLRPMPDVIQDVRRIAQESERAARIVRNLLAFARRQSTARAPQDLAQICARTLALREYEFRVRRIAVETELAGGLPAVFADAGQLQQVLLNLVLNAEQAMRASERRALRVAVRRDETAGGVELSVSDTGHGIDAGSLSRIFDPFFTTRGVGEGTGLGLSICYGIVRDHGGTITAESTPGAGTTFRVLLPARLPAEATAGTVLVAHADQSEREFLAAACSAWGDQTLVAGTLADALALDGLDAARVVVVDRGLLAADQDGWQRLREAGTQPLVLISPFPDDESDNAGWERPVRILRPPIDLRSLYGAIRSCVAKECV